MTAIKRAFRLLIVALLAAVAASSVAESDEAAVDVGRRTRRLDQIHHHRHQLRRNLKGSKGEPKSAKSVVKSKSFKTAAPKGSKKSKSPKSKKSKSPKSKKSKSPKSFKALGGSKKSKSPKGSKKSKSPKSKKSKSPKSPKSKSIRRELAQAQRTLVY
jgi:hypothetical protein